MSLTLPEKDRVRLQHMLQYAREAVQFTSDSNGYDFLDYAIIWQTAVADLPSLIAQFDQILATG